MTATPLEVPAFDPESTNRPASADEGRLLSAIVATQGEIAAAGLDPRKVVDVVTRRAQELTQSSGAIVELLEGDEMVYWSASGTAAASVGLRLKAATSLSGLCVRTGGVLQCDDSEADPRVDREACRRVGLRSMLVVPLTFRERTVGVLKVIAPTPGAYGRSDVRTLELLATLIGATLSHAIAHAAMAAHLHARLDADRRADDDRALWRERIRGVIDRAEISVVFQPIVSLTDGRTMGFEALTRFPPQLALTPDKWFDAAARVGLGLELEMMAVRRALCSLERVPRDTYLSINVSPSVAISREFAATLARTAGRRVVVEITEHSIVEDYALLAERMTGLRKHGVRLAIDDAGAGFASLRHILHLAPELIKLDKSLTSRIDTQPRQQTLAAALLAFAAGSAASLVAEGIETSAELATLRMLSIPLGQGYHLGRPGPLPTRRVASRSACANDM